MLGRLATRIYGIGRNATKSLIKLSVAQKITGSKTKQPKPRKQRPVTAKLVKSKRSNQTIPPKHTPAAKAKFKQAASRV